MKSLDVGTIVLFFPLLCPSLLHATLLHSASASLLLSSTCLLLLFAFYSSSLVLYPTLPCPALLYRTSHYCSPLRSLQSSSTSHSTCRSLMIQGKPMPFAIVLLNDQCKNHGAFQGNHVTFNSVLTHFNPTEFRPR